MKKLVLLIGLILTFLINPTCTLAQDWVSKMNDPEVNFFEVQKSFKKYYVKKEREVERYNRKLARRTGMAVSEEEVEVPGYSQFKRWEWFMAPRVGLNGERFNPSAVWDEYHRYQAQYRTAAAGNWTLIGPTNDYPTDGGAGRLNFVRFDPSNINTIYVGSPGGGLWKSNDAGVTWSTNTDRLSQVIGCTDIAIDPTNTNIMYLATGDGDGGDTYTVGVLKSIDGGATWNKTGLSYTQANYRQISKILINPTNTNIILVATSGGLWKSTDGGVTFAVTQTGSFKDMEFKPGDPNTVYICGTEFYKSTNAGTTFTRVTAVLPATANISRMAIAVTPNDPNYIYLISAKPASDYSFEGLYKSINSGTSFTKVNVTSPTNILGRASSGTDVGVGQGWYDLAIAASPTNKDEVIVGGINLWRSTNGGTSFTLNAHWTATGAPYVHADLHDLVYTNGTTYYISCDGGIFKTSDGGTSFSDLSNGLQIAQMYGFGQSATTASLNIQGWQDNGTNRYLAGNWEQIMGGDGMLCFIDYTNDQNMWGEQYEGNFQRSTNGGATWTSARGNMPSSEIGAFSTPWLQDPVVPTTIYGGLINVWKSINGGTTWTKLSNFTNTATIATLAVSPADNQVIWTAKAGALYKSSDGGTTWTTITSAQPGTISYITCSNTDPNKAWITYSGFTNTSKVFQTNDQGVTWINLSGSIPNIPVNCITSVNNSNDALYIGTDIGVFYKDASLSVWQPFYAGLPTVVVTQLAIFYPTGKLRASTYGRGIWESDLYVAGSYPPSSAFGSDQKIACPGAAVQFTDFSAGQPTSWNWTFVGGSPSSSTQQNPKVYYNTPGNYPVQLTVTNANGTNDTTYNNYVIISTSPFGAPSTVSDSRCGPGVVNLSASGTGTGTLRWWDAPGGGTVVATGNTYSPSINGTTTYYVDEEFPSGFQDFVGELDNTTGSGAMFTANDIRGLYFDVLQPVILNNVDVYANSAGFRTIEVLDGNGNLFVDTTINIVPIDAFTPVTLNLNFKLYPGTNYFIKCRGTVDLYRNSAGVTLPQNSSAINITGTNAGSPGYYYFFYNWVYTSITCNTGRTAATGTDVCTGINELTDINGLEVFPNPNNGIFSLKFNAQKAGNYKVKITNPLGELVYEEELNSFSGKFDKKLDVSNFGKGVYMLSISNSVNESIKRMMVY